MLPLNDTASTKDWYDGAGWTIIPGYVIGAETGGFELVHHGEHDQELAEDLAVAERALDEHGKKGIEDTVSYHEYRTNRLETEP